MQEMTQKERRAFLMEGTRTGKIGITRRDGQPYVLPVWFVLEGDNILGRAGINRRQTHSGVPSAHSCVHDRDRDCSRPGAGPRRPGLDVRRRRAPALRLRAS